MRLRIIQEEAFRFARPVKSLVQVLRLTPRAHAGQHVLRWRIEPSADGRLKPQEDALCNLVHVFSADDPVEELTLRVTGEVETTDTQGVILGTVERLPDLFYLRVSDLTLADEGLRAFARAAAGDAEADPLGALHRLLAAVHEDVAHEEVGHPPASPARAAAKAFAERRGASADLAHVFIAGARSLGVPSRFVSGYLHREDSDGAVHAWAEAKVPGLGWVGFDPACGLCPTDAHVRVAIGLDALGAQPVRGPKAVEGEAGPSVTIEVAPSPPRPELRAQPSAQRQSQG